MATGRPISHVKAKVKGNLFYDYPEEPFLPKDTVAPKSGDIRCDTLSVPGHPSQMLLSHVLDIVKDSTAIYRIGIRMAGEKMPEKAMAFGLAKEIAQSEVLNGRE